MNAVIYARYSSDRQREESIEGQLRECTDYAMRNNLTLIGTYVDRALSARTPDRPDFQRMIADSVKGLFDVVLVWKLDRFSRDRYDSAHYKHVLKKNGVRVISIKENISDGPEGIILESMLEGYAEYYSAELAQKIRRGQHDNAMKCMNNGGNTPLGYYVDKATGRLEINPETAPYVQELFARYADGERLTVLQAEMEERGLRSKRGNAYTVSVLSNLLKNRKYIGEYKYGDVITPDGIPAIIDKELFERVQMRMAANKKAPARAKAEEEYLLTTKLYCGDCGRLMAGESGKGCKGIVYHYYKCSGAKRRLGCKKKAIKKHWIEETVVKLTVSKVLTDEAIDRIADAILVMQEQGDTMTPVLKQQLQQCEAEIRNVMKAIRQGIITETTKECLEDLETQRDSRKASILQLQLERRKFTKEEIVEWISKYKYGNINDLDYRKEIIDKRGAIGKILRQLCEWKGVTILAAEACPDHIHLFVEIPPKISVSGFMGYLKGKSAAMMYEQFGDLKYKYRNKEFWCRGYYVDTVGKNESRIAEYIENQLKEDEMGEQLVIPSASPFTGRK